MSITDVTFLFVFLPIALCTYVFKPALQKYFLLLLSLFFMHVDHLDISSYLWLQ